MAYEKLRLGHSPLTDRVFAGKLSKDGLTWSGNKDDKSVVSFAALMAVAKYMEENKVSEFLTTKGNLKFES